MSPNSAAVMTQIVAEKNSAHKELTERAADLHRAEIEARRLSALQTQEAALLAEISALEARIRTPRTVPSSDDPATNAAITARAREILARCGQLIPNS